MVDGLVALTRRRWVWVVTAILVTVAMTAPAFGGGSPDAAGTTTTSPWAGAPVRTTVAEPTGTTAAPTPTPAATTAPAGTAPATTTPDTRTPSILDAPAPTTTAPPASTTVPGTASTTVPGTTVPDTVPGTATTAVLAAPATSVVPPPAPTIPRPATTRAPGAPGTDDAAPETSRAGDDPNPGQRYPDRPDIRPRDRERAVGLDTEPARFSGWSAWAAATARETTAPDGRSGSWLKVTVRLVNRDRNGQTLRASQWVALGPDGINRAAEFATPGMAQGTEVIGGGEAWAELWFPAPRTGRWWLAFRPDQASDRGVWAIDIS